MPPEEQQVSGQQNQDETDLSRVFEQAGSQPQSQTAAEALPESYSAFIQWLMKISGGFIKSPKQAVLVFVIIGIIIISILFLIVMSGGKKRVFVPISNPNSQIPKAGGSYPLISPSQ
jgi:hypothetical protein